MDVTDFGFVAAKVVEDCVESANRRVQCSVVDLNQIARGKLNLTIDGL